MITKLILNCSSKYFGHSSRIHTYSREGELLRKELPNDIDSSLWFTTLPKKSKSGIISGKKKEVPVIVKPKGPLLIDCKRKEYNHYKGTTYKKFAVIPLASKGWKRTKSKDDFFTINPMTPNPAFLYGDVDPNIGDNFEDFGLHKDLVKQLHKQGFMFPTAIQLKALPKILAGKNVRIAADTGCGKTLCYAIPMIEHVLRWKSKVNFDYNAPFGLVVVPTRELALQVTEVISCIAQPLGITVRSTLSNRIKRFLLNLSSEDFEDVDILVATLGVLCKLTYHKVYSLKRCLHVVIDEADTLLDDSFNDKLKVLFKRCSFRFEDIDQEKVPKGAQLSLVSATKPRDLHGILEGVYPVSLMEEISTKYLHKIQPHIRQTFLRCRKSDKAAKLLALVRKDVKNGIPVMIFSNKTKTSNWLSTFLADYDIECARFNSDVSNEERIVELEKFTSGEVNIISCTDIASRGHDIPRVRHVINYDFPMFMADYVHRCGRTGRLGNDDDCQVTSLISRDYEVELLQKIERAARMNEELPNVNNNISRILYYKYSSEEPSESNKKDEENEID